MGRREGFELELELGESEVEWWGLWSLATVGLLAAGLWPQVGLLATGLWPQVGLLAAGLWFQVGFLVAGFMAAGWDSGNRSMAAVWASGAGLWLQVGPLVAGFMAAGWVFGCRLRFEGWAFGHRPMAAVLFYQCFVSLQVIFSGQLVV